MERITTPDPDFLAEKTREEALTNRTWTDLPKSHSTPHMWRGMMPTGLDAGTHLIEVRGIDPSGKEAYRPPHSAGLDAAVAAL